MNSSETEPSSGLSLEAFADRLGRLMPQLMRRMAVRDRNYFARGLLTLPQLRALEWVADTPAATMHGLSHALGIRASTVTGLVDRLVTLALIRRANSRKDRRVVQATLTPKGRRIVEQFRAEKRRGAMILFRCLSPEERIAYLQTIHKVLTAAKNGEPAPAGRGRRS